MLELFDGLGDLQGVLAPQFKEQPRGDKAR